MNFSKVIMNPPYGKLHLPILKKCVEEFVDIENGGEIVSLQPCGFLTRIDKLFSNRNGIKNLFEFLKTLDNKLAYTELDSTETAKLFNLGKEAFKEEIGILIISNSFKKSIISNLTKNIPIKTINKLYDFKKSIRSQFVSLENAKEHFVRCYRMSDKGLIWNDNGNPKDGINFDSIEEKNNFINSINCNIYKIYALLNKKNINRIDVNPARVPFMEDYTEPWTNERFYKYFELTEDEIKIIEDTIK